MLIKRAIQIGYLCFLFLAAGCAIQGRFLVVRSDPADAEVCIRGKSKSSFFSNEKHCVGTTPFEADRVEIQNEKGDFKTIKFKDVDYDHESFYVVVSRPGFAPQAIEVPGWEHAVVLKPDHTLSTSNEPAILKIKTEPSDAIISINGKIVGNSPFRFEGKTAVVKVKAELEGYRTVEKDIQVEGGKELDVLLKMITLKEALEIRKKSQVIQTQPIFMEVK